MNTKFIDDTLYQLEKDFPQIINVHQLLESVVDIDTGKKVITKQHWKLKCIKLPESLYSSLAKALSLKSDLTKSKWAIRKLRVPKNFDNLSNLYLVENNNFYQITNIDNMFGHLIVSGVALEGTPLSQIRDLIINSSIQVTGGTN